MNAVGAGPLGLGAQCATECLPPSPISSSFNQLEGEISTIEEIVDMLHSKISPVLLATPSNIDKEMKRETSSVPVAARVDESVFKLQRIKDRLNMIKSQVAL